MSRRLYRPVPLGGLAAVLTALAAYEWWSGDVNAAIIFTMAAAGAWALWLDRDHRTR